MNQIVGDIDSFVWGPVMLCLLVGTGISVHGAICLMR
jgi:Na+/alanine symporter